MGNELLDSLNRAEELRAKTMPAEQDAINAMYQAYLRLQELGWKEILYCPKDGSTFLAIEPGSTGIHTALWLGDILTGSIFAEGGGDLWPMRPCLFKRKEA